MCFNYRHFLAYAVRAIIAYNLSTEACAAKFNKLSHVHASSSVFSGNAHYDTVGNRHRYSQENFSIFLF